MTPRFVFLICVECEDDFMHTNCFGAGKYCAVDSGNDLIQGKEIVLEDLRQTQCVIVKSGESSQKDKKEETKKQAAEAEAAA
jgi:hypothetical protein